MSFDQREIQRSFSRAAAHYDEHAWLQWEIGQRLLQQAQLDQLQPAMIVDAGCGTGRLTAVLKQRWPKARVMGVDSAPGMVSAAARRHQHWRRRFEVVQADLASPPVADREVDLLVCNLALQWCEDLPAVFNAWRRIMKPGGLVLFATFGPDTLHELRTAWAAVDQRPHISPFPDLHQVGDYLMNSGFRDPVMSSELINVTYADSLKLMRELKAIGAHNADRERPRGLTGRQALSRMREAYEQFRREGRLPATWEVVYGAAWGPEEGQPVRTSEGEMATFSVDALRKTRR